MWNAKRTCIYIIIPDFLTAIFQGNVLVALPTVRFHIVSSSIQMRWLWTFQCLLNEVVIATIIVSSNSEEGTPFRIEKKQKQKKKIRTQNESRKSVISPTVDVWCSLDTSLQKAKSLSFFKRALSIAFSNKVKFVRHFRSLLLDFCVVRLWQLTGSFLFHCFFLSDYFSVFSFSVY